MNSLKRGAPLSGQAQVSEPVIGFYLGCLGVVFSIGVLVLFVSLFAPDAENVTGGLLFIGLGWIIVMFMLGSKWGARGAWRERNALDYQAAQEVLGRLADFATEPNSVSESSNELHKIRSATIGEIGQHFDKRISASVTGWLQHELGLHGWGLSTTQGAVGVAVGRMGVTGRSQVGLDVSGLLRDELAGDGFIAILEREEPDGAVETTRVIAPSQSACREYVTALATAIGATFGAGSHVEVAFKTAGLQLSDAFQCEVSHVADQLRAILRQPPGRRQTVSVVGGDIEGWAILPSAIQIGDMGQWRNLFPLHVVHAILAAASDIRRKYPTLSADTDNHIAPH